MFFIDAIYLRLMSFDLAHQSKTEAGGSKIPAANAKRSYHARVMDSHDSIIHLQRTIGNQAVQRLLP
jgi:Domain of unknown function (DUF4157)